MLASNSPPIQELEKRRWGNTIVGALCISTLGTYGRSRADVPSDPIGPWDRTEGEIPQMFRSDSQLNERMVAMWSSRSQWKVSCKGTNVEREKRKDKRSPPHKHEKSVSALVTCISPL